MDHATSHHSSDHYLQQATDATTGRVEGLPGCWKLGAGRALTLHASQAGELRIAHGRVWVTFNNAGQDLSVRAGDHFLSRGDGLFLRAGESLVMESFGIGHVPSAYFSWEPARASRSETVSRVGVPGLAGRAMTRLATAFAISFVAARARCTSPERSFNPRTCE
ncbi:DUF2917 domain-containing protein [Polaromonas jejuensis]|uniref:DUF2917 domain-containing protein n=1 Tax=Polaromonas jejuensis TaxID=457502 RepID=A0ABW0QDC2_9BURK|nr:DUF2917 domain-containing protein [Polaromonas jejuensis]